MSGIYLFDLASMQARHLAVRQSTIAGNVANANTPDYKARDVTPFAQVLASAGFGMAQTASAHVEGGGPGTRVQDSKDGWDVLETASGVSIEQELLKAGTVAREHSLNTGIVKAFDRMLKLAVKG
ncbi:flagellar basal body rod protein FlgB [Methylobacterium radiodurans]|uniref:Flagellar basal body rod protein FlgB n=1 Tax=Methylobacterium radiodurans TaxID=2202828 RepID=A0A2U8W0Y6_9HYPH|nr:flagellar basal body rod protein FlgB [Methylobacterium radiodurans]AWN39122.1 flagellar basal body rod protein FlgB [Methylobacterium radiodurans]